MADMRRFEQWARRARNEAAPQPEVVHAVMGRLRHASAQSATANAARPDLWLWLFSAASGCAAVVCAALGYGAWVAMGEPWASWLQDLLDWGIL
jgi:hypothetical protein